MSATFEGGVEVSSTGRRGEPALTAPESLTGAEDYRVRHLRRNGRPVTTSALAIERENGEKVLPPAAVMAQVQRGRPLPERAPDVVVAAGEDFGDAYAQEDEQEYEEERPQPRRRRRLVARVQPDDWDTSAMDERRDETIASVPTMAHLAAFEEKIQALIAASEKRVLKRVQRLIDAALEEVE